MAYVQDAPVQFLTYKGWAPLRTNLRFGRARVTVTRTRVVVVVVTVSSPAARATSRTARITRIVVSSSSPPLQLEDPLRG